MSVPQATREVMGTRRTALWMIGTIVFYALGTWWFASVGSSSSGLWFPVFGIVYTGALLYLSIRDKRGLVGVPWGMGLVVALTTLLGYVLVNAVHQTFGLRFMITSAAGYLVIWTVGGWLENLHRRRKARAQEMGDAEPMG